MQSPTDWLERRARVAAALLSDSSSSCSSSCSCHPNPTTLTDTKAAVALRIALDTASHDSSVSPLYPRGFSLNQRAGTSVALETLSVNFPDEVSAAFRADVGLGAGAPDLRAALGGGVLGALAEQVRLWFAWHYFGGTHSILWGTPAAEKSPMSPTGEWYEDAIDERAPASARLSVPVTSEMTSCPDCVGCAARYCGAFDLFIFIHSVRRVDRCAHAGGSVPALEVTYIDGARARAAVAAGRLSADDLTSLINYANALASIEAATNGVRTDAAIEAARGCCVNTHYKDTATSISAVSGVLAAMSDAIVPSRAQAAVIAGAPRAELGLFRAALLPLDWDLWAWAAQCPRATPARLLPLCASLSSALGSSSRHKLPHLLACMRAAIEALTTAQTMERLRRSEVTFRASILLSGRRSEALPRLRAPDVCAPPRIAPALHLDLLINYLSWPRDRQAPGEALADAPSVDLARAGRAEPAPISAWEAGTNLAAITGFAAAATLACGAPDAASPHVLLWLPPPKTAPAGGGGKAALAKAAKVAEKKAVKAAAAVAVAVAVAVAAAAPGSAPGSIPATAPAPAPATATAVLETPTTAGASATVAAATPATPDDVWFTRALTAPPTHASAPWITVAFTWFRTRLQVAGFCDPVRRAATPRDERVLAGLALAASALEDAYTLVRCDACGANDMILYVCDCCKMRVYCSPACQRRDWESGHSSICFPLQPTAL